MPAKISGKNRLENSAFDQSVGDVVSFVGLKGDMKVIPSSNNLRLFLDIKNVLLKYKNKANEPEQNIQATVKSIKIAKNCFLIQLKEYSSRTAVEPFRGAAIFTPKNELKKLKNNEWWVDDLIGMNVFTTEGELIGTVCGALGENGEFLEIKKVNDNKGETVIVSFVDQLFPVVDVKARRIEVNNPPGLFE